MDRIVFRASLTIMLFWAVTMAALIATGNAN